MMRPMLTRLWRPLCLALLAGMLLGGCAATAGTPSQAVASATPAPAFPATTAGGLAARAQRAIGGLGSHVEATYDAQQQAATVTITVDGTLPNTAQKMATAYALVKRIIFQVMPALWSSGAPLSKVTVTIVGPVQDEYAGIITDWYGFAVVAAPTAQRIQWASSSPDAAWAMYDQDMLRVSFELVD